MRCDAAPVALAFGFTNYQLVKTQIGFNFTTDSAAADAPHSAQRSVEWSMIHLSTKLVCAWLTRTAFLLGVDVISVLDSAHVYTWRPLIISPCRCSFLAIAPKDCVNYYPIETVMTSTGQSIYSQEPRIIEVQEVTHAESLYTCMRQR
jgi:hypothetical protein